MTRRIEKLCIDCGATIRVLPNRWKMDKRCRKCQDKFNREYQKSYQKSPEHRERARLYSARRRAREGRKQAQPAPKTCKILPPPADILDESPCAAGCPYYYRCLQGNLRQIEPCQDTGDAWTAWRNWAMQAGAL